MFLIQLLNALFFILYCPNTQTHRQTTQHTHTRFFKTSQPATSSFVSDTPAKDLLDFAEKFWLKGPLMSLSPQVRFNSLHLSSIFLCSLPWMLCCYLIPLLTHFGVPILTMRPVTVIPNQRYDLFLSPTHCLSHPCSSFSPGLSRRCLLLFITKLPASKNYFPSLFRNTG